MRSVLSIHHNMQPTKGGNGGDRLTHNSGIPSDTSDKGVGNDASEIRANFISTAPDQNVSSPTGSNSSIKKGDFAPGPVEYQDERLQTSNHDEPRRAGTSHGSISSSSVVEEERIGQTLIHARSFYAVV